MGMHSRAFLGLTSPAPTRRLTLEFCQFGNWVPRKDRNGAPFALPARCRPQSPFMAPHLNCRIECLGHRTLRVEGRSVFWASGPGPSDNGSSVNPASGDPVFPDYRLPLAQLGTSGEG
jgi:hypothetical protein